MINYTTEHKTGAYNPFQGLQWRIACSHLGKREVCNYERNSHIQTVDHVNEYMPLVDHVNGHVPIVDHVNGYMPLVDRVYYPTARTMVNHCARVARVTPLFHSLTLRLASIKTSAPQLWRKYGDCT